MSSDRGCHSLGGIPFLWENHPGVSKERPACTSKDDQTLKLLPPPCPPESPKLILPQDLYVPLPPCPFGSPVRLGSTKRSGGRRVEDPFLAALMECTKSKRWNAKASDHQERRRADSWWLGLRGSVVFGLGLVSCKRMCGVREDGIVRLTQLPPLPAVERHLERRWRQRNVHGHGST